MAAYEGRPLVMEMEHEEDFNAQEEASSSGCGCGCFRVFSLNWWRGHEEEEGRKLLEQKGEGEAWVREKVKKVKEISEVIAGPKWKNFIRKISGYGNKKKQQQRNNKNNRFQYDEQSYALNFNSGAQSEDEDNIRPSFSARFTAPLPAGPRRNEL